MVQRLLKSKGEKERKGKRTWITYLHKGFDPRLESPLISALLVGGTYTLVGCERGVAEELFESDDRLTLRDGDCCLPSPTATRRAPPVVCGLLFSLVVRICS
jgi:hypothetical protein